MSASSRAVNDFLASCGREEADIYYTIIPKETTEAVFPGTKRTYIRLRDVRFTGGNVHLVRKETFLKTKTAGERIFAKRKSPFGLIRLLGFTFVTKFLLGRLTIASLEQKAGRSLSARVKAVVTAYPELGVDVDKPEDLRLAQA